MRIGVIGAAGKIGQMRVQTIIDNPDTTLAAVMDMDMHRAEAVANGAPAFTDADRFFDVGMDAVVISTPAHVREPLCMAAFDRGLHVLSEKPLANTVEASRRIVAAARAAGRALGGGFNMRYYPAFSYVKDVIGSGQIGEVDHVRIYGGHEGLTKFVHDWEYKSDISGGGALWDVGIHMTDMARHLLGEITSAFTGLPPKRSGTSRARKTMQWLSSKAPRVSRRSIRRHGRIGKVTKARSRSMAAKVWRAVPMRRWRHC